MHSYLVQPDDDDDTRKLAKHGSQAEHPVGFRPWLQRGGSRVGSWKQSVASRAFRRSGRPFLFLEVLTTWRLRATASRTPRPGRAYTHFSPKGRRFDSGPRESAVAQL